MGTCGWSTRSEIEKLQLLGHSRAMLMRGKRLRKECKMLQSLITKASVMYCDPVMDNQWIVEEYLKHLHKMGYSLDLSCDSK